MLRFQISPLADPSITATAYAGELDFRANGPRPTLRNAQLSSRERIRAGALADAKIYLKVMGTVGLDEAIERERRRGELAEEAGIVLFQFDLAKPLQPQIRKAEESLAGHQEHSFGRRGTRRPNRENWPLYLRALDAKDAGATFAEMAQAFWPTLEKTPQSARDTHVAACQLRDNFPV